MKRLVFLTLFLFLFFTASAQSQRTSFDCPAANWTSDVMTISNDSFSASFLGGIAREVIRWKGITQRKDTFDVSRVPAGEIILDFPGFKTAEEYSRELDTLTNIATTLIRSHELDVRRELFYSPYHHVFVVYLQVTEESSPLNFRISLTDKQGVSAEPYGHILVLNDVDSTVCSETMLFVKTDGEGIALPDREAIRVIGAREVTLYFVSDTRMISPRKSFDKRDLTAKQLHRDLLLRLKSVSLRSYSRLKRNYCNKITRSPFK